MCAERPYAGFPFLFSPHLFRMRHQICDVTLPDGSVAKVASETGNVVQPMTEKNFMFRLGAFKERLLKWLTDNPKGWSVAPS